MANPTKTLEFKFERTIPAAPEEVFDAWLDPQTPGTPWHENEKLILNPKLDGLWYWLVRGKPHYGRFTEVQRPARIRLTWMSRHTLGEESIVTLTFKQQGDETLMTLVHSGLPDDDLGRGHEAGWNYFMDKLLAHFKG